jgi:hypothetical protein
MRTRLLLQPILLVLCSLAACNAVLAQDPAKIIDQYIKATGGSSKLSKLQTLTIEGSLTRASDAKTGTFTFDSKSPNRYYLELIAGEQPEILAYNGKSAWHLSAQNEPETLLGQDAVQLEAASTLACTHLLNLKKNKIGTALLGPAKVGSHDALEIEFTMPTGVKRQFYFDSSSRLLLKESGLTGGVPQETLYDDSRPESGIQVAHKIELRRGNETYNIVVTRVAVNQTIGERIFDFPRKSQVQLPDLKKLFEEIDANQKTLDKIRENYTGRRVEEETEFDGSGKVSKLERSEYTFFYLHGDEISTLVGKDSKPLSEAEQAKQNDLTKKRIEEIQKRQAKKDEKEEKAREARERRKNEKDKKDEKDDDEPGIEIFLRACQFVNPRHERFRGQDVLVFDFEGNPEYKPKKMVEKIVQQLAGVVWIDEKQHEVARLEAYFVKDFRFAGGLLANLQKGTSFIFEQAFINNEVWLPTYEEAHIGVRVLLVKGLKVNEVTRYSDYQRFHVETLSTVAKPKETGDPPDKQP